MSFFKCYLRAWQLGKWCRGYTVCYVLINLLYGIMFIGIPIITGFVFQNVITVNTSSIDIQRLPWVYILSYIVIFLVLKIISFFLQSKLQTVLYDDIDKYCFEKFFNTPKYAVAKIKEGELQRRYLDIDTLVSHTRNYYGSLVPICTIIALSIWLLYTSPYLILIALIYTLLIPYYMHYNEKLKILMDNTRKVGSRGPYSHILYTLNKYNDITNMSANQKIFTIHRNLISTFVQNLKKWFYYESAAVGIMDIFQFIMAGISLIGIYYLVLQNKLNINDTVPFLIVISIFKSSLLTMVSLYLEKPSYELQLESFDFFANQPQIPKRPKGISGNQLVLKNITFAYDTIPIIKNLNATFTKDKITIICGANGSGKSTILESILGQYPNIKGDILLDNEPIVLKDNVTLLAADNHYFYDGDILSDSKAIIGNDAILDTIKDLGFDPNEIIETTPLPNAMQLSTGQKKVSAIARALVTETPVLLLDEPFNALSQQVSEKLVDYLNKMDRIVIIVSHLFPNNLKNYNRFNILKLVSKDNSTRLISSKEFSIADSFEK